MTRENTASLRHERILYAVIWSFIAILPIALELWKLINSSGFEWRFIFSWWIGMIPLVAMFALHDQILIPKFMKKAKIKRYCLIVLVMLLSYGALQYAAERPMRKAFSEHPVPPRPHHDFNKGPMMRPMPEMPMKMPPRPFPFPLVFKMLLAAMTLGANVAISLSFTYYREQAARKELETHRLQEELKYLKQQISPHFFMNVLNNIHEMAEENIQAAQEMILELSCLMRFVLYESEHDMTTLAAESRFISSYVALMKMRYVEDLVKVNLDITEESTEEVHIPPLLFISFIENAFKHGVSYSNKTEINIKLCQNNGKVFFSCDNTIPAKKSSSAQGGVGLANVRRRLELLYGEDYSLRISETENNHNVTLIIPSR